MVPHTDWNLCNSQLMLRPKYLKVPLV